MFWCQSPWGSLKHSFLMQSCWTSPFVPHPFSEQQYQSTAVWSELPFSGSPVLQSNFPSTFSCCWLAATQISHPVGQLSPPQCVVYMQPEVDFSFLTCNICSGSFTHTHTHARVCVFNPKTDNINHITTSHDAARVRLKSNLHHRQEEG